MLLSKLREAVICLKAGQVTLPYPFEPHEPDPGFRGKVTVDPDKCIGCGGCANVCPSNVIVIDDTNEFTRVLEFWWRRCTYCARCQEVCPEQAVSLTQEFETATNDPQDMYIRLEVFMGPCQRCGRCFTPPTPLERMMRTGFRHGEKEGRI
ncbi:MAG: 4Fe-4S dicluster domain-containing protein [Pseudomonadota bacterium]